MIHTKRFFSVLIWSSILAALIFYALPTAFNWGAEFTSRTLNILPETLTQCVSGFVLGLAFRLTGRYALSLRAAKSSLGAAWIMALVFTLAAVALVLPMVLPPHMQHPILEWLDKLIVLIPNVKFVHILAFLASGYFLTSAMEQTI